MLTVMTVCSLILKGPVLNVHSTPNVRNWVMGMHFSQRTPTGYTSLHRISLGTATQEVVAYSSTTTGGNEMAGLLFNISALVSENLCTYIYLMLRNIFSPLHIVTKTMPRIQARTVFAGSPPSTARTAALTSA